MEKYFIKFSYDGSNFYGSQRQPNKRTVQDELEKALKYINRGKFVDIVMSGRTDRKVHAINQTAHFYIDITITLYKLKSALNSLLPSDIHVFYISLIDESFHSRYDVISKEYIYILNMGEYNPCERNYVYQYCRNLDIDSMRKCIKYLEGEHNFKAFTKVNCLKNNYVRKITKVSIECDRNNKDKIIFTFKGTGFLKYMVRNMVGTLIEVGLNKRSSESIIHILNSLDRTQAGKTARPEGLYLKDVQYK